MGWIKIKEDRNNSYSYYPGLATNGTNLYTRRFISGTTYYSYRWNGGTTEWTDTTDPWVSDNTNYSTLTSGTTSYPSGTAALPTSDSDQSNYYVTISSGTYKGKWGRVQYDYGRDDDYDCAILYKWEESGTTTYTLYVYPSLTGYSYSTTGGSVTINGVSTNSGSYTSGTSVSLRATAKSGYTFEGWYINNTKKSSYASYTYTTTNSSVTIYAKFIVNTTYTLTISKQLNGSATSSTVMGTTSGGGSYSSGSTASLTATINTGYIFDGWYNSSGTLLSSSSPYNYTVTSNVTIIAKWKSYTNVVFNLNSNETYKETYNSNLITNAVLTGTLSSGSSYYNYPIGRSADTSDTYNTNMYAPSNATAYITYSFTLPSLQSGLSYTVEAKCKGQAKSTTISDNSMAKCSLYYTSSELASTNFTTTSTSTITLTCSNLSYVQAQNIKLRFTVAHNGGKLFGVTLNITGTSTSNVTKRLTYDSTTNNKVGIVTTNDSSYQFTGWYTEPSDGDKVYDNNGSYTTNSNYWSSGKWRYYDSSSSTLNLYTQEEAHTLIIRYHLNGGILNDRIHQYSSSYYTYKTDGLLYKCNSDGSGLTLFTHTYTCTPSQSSSTYVDLINITSLNNGSNGLTRGNLSVPNNSVGWRSGSRSGTVFSAATGVVTVHDILNGNLTQDREVTVYVNWNTSKYYLNVFYRLNGGSISGVTSHVNTETGVTEYYKSKSMSYETAQGVTQTDNFVFQCTNSTGNVAAPLVTHVEFSSTSTTLNLTNISSFNAQNGDFRYEGSRAYKNESGTELDQGTDAVTVANVGGSGLVDKTVIIYVNWLTNGGSIYVKTSSGWVQGTPYVKTSGGWVQGTVYVKTSNGWVQSI